MSGPYAVWLPLCFSSTRPNTDIPIHLSRENLVRGYTVLATVMVCLLGTSGHALTLNGVVRSVAKPLSDAAVTSWQRGKRARRRRR